MKIFDWVQQCLDRPILKEWAHGWETDRVVGSRYANPHLGINIGFRFPKNPHDCDRSELVDCIKQYNGCIYQMGGFPGAEIYAVFSDVKDKSAATEKIKQILPALDKLIRSF